MKVLLVEPPISPYDIITGVAGLPEPLALETIAAPLLANHEVHILDLRIEPDALDRYLAEIQPQVVGVGSVTANLHLAKQILRRAKEFNPATLTMIGGHHVTFKPEDAAESFIDIIVKGEADQSALQVIEAFEQGQAYHHINGLVINHQGLQHTTGNPELLEMDTLPLPARHLVARYRQHYFQRAYRPIVSLNTSRGCPNRCDFCSLWKMNQGKYRVRSADLVVDEIEGLTEGFIDFIDDNSLEDIPRTQRLADLLIERGISKRLKLYGRADTVVNHPELIARLSAAGMEMLLVGFESVREDKLKNWNKRSTLELNRRAIEILQRNQVRVISYFVVDPDFEKKDFEALRQYVDEMDLLAPIFTILVPFPGTNLYAQQAKNIHYADYRLFDFFHTVFQTRLPLPEFYEQFALLYERAYAKERQLAHVPPNVPPAILENMAKEFEEVFRRIRSLASHHQMAMEAIPSSTSV